MLGNRQGRSIVLLGGIVLIFAVVIAAAGIGLNQVTNPQANTSPTPKANASSCGEAPAGHPRTNPVRKYTKAPAVTLDQAKQYTAQICTDKGLITLKLRVTDSPIAANNFAFLARSGYYDGLKFHRVCPNATDSSCGGTLHIAQGGDPAGDGSGGPGYTIQDEPVHGTYTTGSVAMAKTSAPNSAGSQFFLDTGDNSFPPNYQIFADIVGGLDVAQALVKGDHIVWANAVAVAVASPTPSAAPAVPGAPSPGAATPSPAAASPSPAAAPSP